MNYLTTSKVIGYLAIIFIAGGAAGAVITLQSERDRSDRPASMEKACGRHQDKLISQLGLTPDQVARLQPVFDETAQELRNIQARAIRDTDDILRKAYQRIAEELTPDQKAKLEALDADRRDWMRRRVKER